MIKIGIVKESFTDEKRCAAVPETVVKMIKAGMEVFVEAGTGASSFISDQAFQEAGAKILTQAKEVYSQANTFLRVNKPSSTDVEQMASETTLIAPLAPAFNKELIQQLNQRKITAFSLDLLPRIARAQPMDILSSMSNLAGYKSVIMAADYLPKIFPMMTTAAGTIPPAKVIVIGAGVAGLQAIATARRLGGVVLGFDTRPVAAEQVRSLGAEFVSMETVHDQAQDAQGYAKEQTAEFYKQEQDIVAKYSKDTDVIITTALIPGKKAPVLITQKMVQEMKKGSVIVDLAAPMGGNCELTEPGKIVVKHEITIIGLLNLPSTLAANASQLYSRNVYNFLNYLAPQLTAKQFDLTDELIKHSLITYQGTSYAQ